MSTQTDTFTDHYIVALFWSEVQDSGEPMDDDYDRDDLAPEALAQIKQECEAFQADNAELLSATPEWYSDEQGGHDYALTRNGHGVGFWDRGLGSIGDQLSKAADADGTMHLYVGDDGQVYV